MADYLFQTGTCLKQDLYETIKGIMVSAGWTNISTNYATDGDVMYSTGENNDKTLFFQMRDTNASAANSIKTTDYNVMSYRLPNVFTAGTGTYPTGTAGTSERTVANEAWKVMYIAPTATVINRTTTITYRYNCNKNRLIFIVEYPEGTAIAPVLNYIGIPDIVYGSDTGSRGLIVATTGGASAANIVQITNAVAELPNDTASSTRAVYCQLSAKNPNTSGKYMMSEMYYGNTTEGMRGKITGVFALPNQNILNGDTITVGTKQYRVIVAGSLNYNSFPSLAVAYQIA
jgi:hypothetical protein